MSDVLRDSKTLPMNEPSLQEESIFAQALRIGSVTERAAFLDRACGDNPSLRAEVEANHDP
jgi:hypothetical protein